MQVRDKVHSTLRSTRATAQPLATDEVGVIDVGKRLDYHAAERMKRRLKKLAAQGRLRHIVDLTELDTLDSGGLAGLISALRAVRETGGSIALVANTNHVTHILELTALSRIFKVHSSLQAALASV